MAKNTDKYEMIDISELHPYENNARTHSDSQLEAICNSIKEFGFINPVIIDENNMILVGHGRIEASKRLGIKQAPFRRVTNLTDDQKKAYILADNRLSDLGGWDEEMLAQELESISLDMSAFGFEDFNIDIDEPEPEIEEDDFDVDGAFEMESRVERGQVWKLGEHRLMCGDSTSAEDISKLMNGKKADMVLTDIPYGMNLDTDYSGMKNNLEMSKEKSLTGGKKYAQGIVDDFKPEMLDSIFSLNAKETFIWGADYFAELLPHKNDGSWIVWDKRSNNNDDIEADDSSDKMYGSCFELCWSKNKHKRDIARVKWAGVFGTEQEFDHKRFHPTQKPIKLSAWFLERYSQENQMIVDLFGGSGSTLLACEQLKRKCFMMELDEHYCEVIIQRWESLTGKKAELIK